jgi:hypothetical protein
MGLLLFKKVFAQPIVTGQKTTTLRRWDRPRCRPGQRVFAPGVGYLQVTEVQQVLLKNLSDHDAQQDGFPTTRALRATLKSLYGSLRNQKLYRVRFHFLGSKKPTTKKVI